MSDAFIAEIRMFAGNFPPRGWAFCNGQLLSIAQNAALFSLIGTTYGGDGVSTIALPDLQGRAPMHPGNGPGLTSRRLGETGGAATVTLTEADLPGHDHTVRASPNGAIAMTPEGNLLAGGLVLYGPPTSPLRETSSAAVAPAGDGFTPHDNMQPYLGLNFIIALFGTYPSRS